MTTYLVTGGCGFIGSNYIHYMFRKYGDDIRIINLDALTYAGNPENLNDIPESDKYHFVHGNICDRELVREIFAKEDIDYVIHFAAETHVDRSITGPEAFIMTNVVGTMTLLTEAMEAWKQGEGFAEGKRFIHISTDEVYGSLGAEGYFYEDTPYDPHSPYSASKASSDFLVKSFVDTYRFPACITNCSNNYGPYQFPEKLIPLMITNALAGKPLPVYGDGLNIRDWLYVDDHAKGIDMVCHGGRIGEKYNIGGHNERTNVQIVKTIISTLRELLPESDVRLKHISEDLISYVEDRKGHDRRYAIAPDKIKSELGWTPETTFEEGIKKTIKWYLENESWLASLSLP